MRRLRAAAGVMDGLSHASANADGAPSILSAFLGLDDSGQIAVRTALVCQGAAGRDGMPVILSHEVDPNRVDPEDFRVIRASGAVGPVGSVIDVAPIAVGDPGDNGNTHDLSLRAAGMAHRRGPGSSARRPIPRRGSGCATRSEARHNRYETVEKPDRDTRLSRKRWLMAQRTRRFLTKLFAILS